jgi:hypothetical protein
MKLQKNKQQKSEDMIQKREIMPLRYLNHGDKVRLLRKKMCLTKEATFTKPFTFYY